MCEPTTIIAAVGLGLSIAGTAYSASQQAAASKAQNESNNASVAASNRAFWLRNSNSTNYLAEQADSQNKALAATEASSSAMRSGEASALAQKAQVLDSENTSAQAIRDQADKQQQALLDQTSGQSLSGAQASEQASREASFAPIAQNIATSSPLGSPDAGSTTKQAFASRLAEAADAVKDYGKKVAAVASYTAPLETIGRSITNNSTGLMPVAAANQLLQSGQSARLLPSQEAYQVAANEGAQGKDAIQAALSGDLSVAKTRYDGLESVISLEQNNRTTNASNAATQAANEAKVGQSVGSLISSAGNLAAYGSGRLGGTGASSDALIFAPTTNNGIITGRTAGSFV